MIPKGVFLEIPLSANIRRFASSTPSRRVFKKTLLVAKFKPVSLLRFSFSGIKSPAHEKNKWGHSFIMVMSRSTLLGSGEARNFLYNLAPSTGSLSTLPLLYQFNYSNQFAVQRRGLEANSLVRPPTAWVQAPTVLSAILRFSF